jgi:hypothetical protein
MDEDEIQYQAALDEARLNSAISQDSTVATAGDVPQKRNEPIIDMLRDMPYILAIIVGVGKDISDFFGIGSSPIVGTLITILVMIVLALLIFLASPSEFFGNFMVLFGGTAIEEIPVLNLLPVMTATIIYIYVKKILKRIAENKMKNSKALRLVKYAAKFS